jgi:tetratricopeptide (TPR) repeat protein
MNSTAQIEYMHGVQLALAGRFVEAIEAFERSLHLEPDALNPALNLLEAYQDAERWKDADELATRLLEQHPEQEAVLLALARLCERQGQVVEALAYISNPNVSRDRDSFAFPVYLRLLLANSQFQAALLEAERGLGSSLWRAQALLTRATAVSHLGEHKEALRLFEQLGSEGFGMGDPLRSGLTVSWAQALRRAGETEQAKRMLQENLAQNPQSEVLKELLSDIEVD